MIDDGALAEQFHGFVSQRLPGNVEFLGSPHSPAHRENA
jgi:hypothetical protein